jgi:hypothetical protein
VLVKMLNSVGEDYVAGEEYDLDEETATRFLANGYAESDEVTLSEEQIADLSEGNQTVGV